MASGGTKVVISAIAGNSFITVIKFIGWFFSQSPSLLAEAIHSTADTCNQILLLIGLNQSQIKSSREYPRGFGEARYLWNLVSAVGIFFVGFGVTAFHGLHSLVSGHYEIGPFSWIGITVLVISFVVEFGVFRQAIKEVNQLRKGKSYFQYLMECDDPTVMAVLLEDGVAVLGVLFALVGIFLGQFFKSALFDIGASLLIALLLGFMAILLGTVNGKLLIGKSINGNDEAEIKKFIEGFPEIKHIERFSTVIFGANQIRLSIELELYGHLLIEQKLLEADAKRIQQGDSPIKILTKTAQRMVRLTGEKINQIELRIQEKYPQITLIDLEIH